MATLAKHIQIARTQGPEAGMEAYLNAPSSRRHPAYAAITRKRTPETRLAAYCKQFATQLDSITPRVPAVQEAHIGNVQEMIEAIQAQIAALTGAPVEVEAEVEAEVEFITAGAAWEALGADETFKPRGPANMAKPATNGQLYRLNALGRLTLS